MIPIDRNDVDTPAVLKDDAKGLKETREAIKHYEEGNDGAFKYKWYRHREVKDALIKLFKGKCAYCESKFLHVYSGDVEHFRPKGEITEANPSKPGYYWLAAEWTNLLLSCRNCNQKLKHLFPDSAKKRTGGKMNQFPLRGGARHVQTHEKSVDLEEDHRLLLNPCKDNPQRHLRFHDKEGVIVGMTDMGKASIKVLALQRMPLVQEREKLLIEIWAQIQRVEEGMKHYDEALQATNTDKQLYFDIILKRELKRLKAYCKPTEEFSAMAQQVVNEFLKGLNPI
ncbi:MAG: hypothetical protein JJ975_02700 [Bacteroidia bacterium]|nr:hypothetical protein [Bacteroidia bacterium]